MPFSKFLEKTCKIGQGADCCRYITAGTHGFECAKKNGLRSTIDARVNTMIAKGDNCAGVDDLEAME